MAWLLANFSRDPGACPEAGGDRRAASRRRLRFESVLSGARAPAKAIVLDLSEAGLMIHATEDLAVGEVFEVMLTEDDRIEASVVWKRTRLYGCRFLSPISRAMISAVLLKAEPGEPTV